MAGKTTRVTAVIAAKVEGTDDITDLAKQLADIPDKQEVEVGAAVTGDQEVSGLADDIAALPSTTSVKVDANTTGDQAVTGLADDIRGLPASTTTTVKANTTGAHDVETLAADIKGLPSGANTKVDATTTGDHQLDTLVKKLAALPAQKNVAVNARVDSAGGGGLKKLKKDLDSVEESAKGAGESVSGFASESTGTLGSQFSGGIGTVADFGEQFRNLKGAFAEAGGGLGAFGKVFGGVAATIGAGLIFDQISGELEHANEVLQETKAIVKDVTGALIDNGNQWDDVVQSQVISAALGSQAFQDLLAAGANVGDLLDTITKGDTAAWGRVWDEVENGPKAFDSTTIAALKTGETLLSTKSTAEGLARAVLDYKEANGIDSSATTDKEAASWQNVAKGVAVTRGEYDSTAGAGQALTDVEVDQWLVDQQQAARDAATALLEQSAAAAQAAVDNDALNTALGAVDAAAARSQRSLQFFGAELDKLAGLDRTAEQAAADLASGILGLGDAAAQAGKDNELNSKALKDWNVAALNATKGGQAIYSSVNQVRTAYDESVNSAYDAAAATGDLNKANQDARKAADDSRDAFVSQHKAMGLTKKEAEQLADKVGILAGKDIPDKTFDILADDKKAKDKLAKANAAKLKDKQNTLDSKDKASPKVDTANRKKLPDKKNTLDSRDAASPKVDAANRKGLQNKKNTIDTTDHATPKVDGYNSTPLQNKTAIVDADTQPAKDEIARLNGVNVDVNLVPHLDSQALAAEARRNGVNVSTGSYIPPAGPTATGMATGTTVHPAPRMRFGVTVPVAVTPSPITINVSGALDPASTARQIQQILTRAERRTGPLRSGQGLRAPV